MGKVQETLQNQNEHENRQNVITHYFYEKNRNYVNDIEGYHILLIYPDLWSHESKQYLTYVWLSNRVIDLYIYRCKLMYQRMLKSLENSEGLTDGHLHGILRPVFKWAYKITPDWPINPVYDYTYTMNWMSDLRLFCHMYICIYSVMNEFTDLLVIDEYWYIYFTWNRLALFNPWSVIHFYLLVNSIRSNFTSNENKGTD